jgi:hypothetical protein
MCGVPGEDRTGYPFGPIGLGTEPGEPGGDKTGKPFGPTRTRPGGAGRSIGRLGRLPHPHIGTP